MPWARTAGYWKSIPPLSTAIFLGAVFCLFGCFGVIQSIVQYERRGAIVRVLWVVLSGGFAAAWAFLATRRLIPHMAILGTVQFVVTAKAGKIFDRISTSFDPRSDPAMLKHFLIKDAAVIEFGPLLAWGAGPRLAPAPCTSSLISLAVYLPRALSLERNGTIPTV